MPTFSQIGNLNYLVSCDTNVIRVVLKKKLKPTQTF